MQQKNMSVLTIVDAFQIVIDLAKQNALDEKTCETEELKEEAEKQANAIEVVSTIMGVYKGLMTTIIGGLPSMFPGGINPFAPPISVVDPIKK